MGKKLFIITGEFSGDIHASRVVEEIRKQNPDIEIEGIGGDNLRNCGVKLFSDQKKMSAMGISPKILINHLSLGTRVVNYITNEYKPDMVLLIDYGAFNLNVAKVLKKKNKDLKIYYYIPPQVWASRKWRINSIKKYIDKVLCIFPFEIDMYEEAGIKYKYCGHPLVAQLPLPVDKNEFFEKHGLDINKKLVSVFPGSRMFELKTLMGIFIRAAKIIKKMHPDVQILVSQAPNLSDDVFNKYLKECDFKIVKGENHAMLSASDALILASGTVALEASLYKTPMIISYRGPWILYLIYLLVRCINMVSLPNIILDKIVVPELIQRKSNPDFIAYNIEKFLYDEDYKNQYLKNIEKVKNLLSDKYSANEAASEILKGLE